VTVLKLAECNGLNRKWHQGVTRTFIDTKSDQQKVDKPHEVSVMLHDKIIECVTEDTVK